MQNGLNPLAAFEQLSRNWWKILILSVLGGLIGMFFSYMTPAKYQAEATFHASIDFTEINFENLVGEYGHPLVFTQYDEDLALQVVERVLLSTLDEAYQYGRLLDPLLTKPTFIQDMQISRYLARWHLRYRHQDPLIAQSIVNFWADIGMEALEEAQATGRAEEFIMIDIVTMADLPQEPTYHQRNTLVLSGSAAGLFIGVVWVDFYSRYIKKTA